MNSNVAINSEGDIEGEEPLVSVLVPCYNHEKYVIECLESIKSLDYSRLELIVSDDCSPDSTFALSEEWMQRNADRFERTLVVRQERNIGVIRNLQFLFDSSQGDYLTYVASDDVLLESGISSRLKLLQEDRNIDAVFGNAQLISSSGAVVESEFIGQRIVKELTSRRLLVSSLLLNWCVPGPVMMLRKAAVMKNGSLGLLPVGLKAEDRYIYIRMASRGKLRFLDAVVAKYRTLQDSMSKPSAPSSFVTSYFVQSDKQNRHLLSGFNRVVIETMISQYSIELNKSSITIAIYKCMNLMFRLVTRSFRMILFIYSVIRNK